jgi:hypothetical protein
MNENFKEEKNQNHYLSGIAEAMSKICSFSITVIFFVIFAAAIGDKKVTLGIIEVLSYLSLFWFIYETLGFTIYLIFSYFQKKN